MTNCNCSMSVKTFSVGYRGYDNYRTRKPDIADGGSWAGAQGLIAIRVVRCLADVEPFSKVFYLAVDCKDVYEIGQP